MRSRYSLILGVLVVIGGMGIGLLMQDLRKPRNPHPYEQAPVPATPEAIDAVARLPMPPQATELGTELERLTALRQTELLAAIRSYSSQQRLAEALGEPAARVETIGGARAWLDANPNRTDELSRRVLGAALEVALAASDLPPPMLGRDGMSWNMTFERLGDGLWRAQPGGGRTTPYYVFVLAVRNNLRLPLRNLAFAVLPKGDVALPAEVPLPAASYLWCDSGSPEGLPAIPPHAIVPMTCKLEIPFIEQVPPATLQLLLRALRSRPLEAWIKQLGAGIPGSAQVSSLQVWDRGVDAANGHAPSARVEAGFYSLPSSPVPHVVTCAERGDCPGQQFARIKDEIIEFMLLVATLVPGYVVAGLQRLIQRKSPITAVVAFVAIAVPFVPTISRWTGGGGGGYGGVLILIYVGCVAIGYWIGYFIGLWAGHEPMSAGTREPSGPRSGR